MQLLRRPVCRPKSLTPKTPPTRLMARTFHDFPTFPGFSQVPLCPAYFFVFGFFFFGWDGGGNIRFYSPLQQLGTALIHRRILASLGLSEAFIALLADGLAVESLLHIVSQVI